MSRLTLLTESEQREFDYPPLLSVENRAIAFSIDDALNKKLKALRTPTNKVGFLLQYAYFKASKRFFFIERFRQEDVDYAAKLMGLSKKKIKMTNYQGATLHHHRQSILQLLSYTSFDRQRSWVEQEITDCVKRVVEPRVLFLDVLHQLHDHCIEIPSYNILAELIAKHYVIHEATQLKTVAAGLNEEQKAALDQLLVVSDAHASGLLNQYKFVNQSSRPKAIQASSEVFKQIKVLVLSLLPVIEALSLTPQCCEYHATWIQKAKLSQIKQIPDERKRYLRLIAFLQHQYVIRQDLFVDLLLRSVQSSYHSVVQQLKQADQLTRTERRTAVRHLTKKHRHYQDLFDQMTEIAHSTELNDSAKVQQITALLDEQEKQNSEQEEKIARLEQSLEAMAKDEDYFNIMEKISQKLQNRVANIVCLLSYNETNSDKTLLTALSHFTDNNGKITVGAPNDFLETEEREVLVNEKGSFRPSLYKILLFFKTADAIKSGNLNLKYSYRYLAIQDYLIDQKTWLRDRDALLTLAGLEAFSSYEKVINTLKTNLDKKYETVNQHITDKLNPYLTINEDKEDRVQVTTPALEERETKHISALLNQAGYTPVLRVLSQIDHVVHFSGELTHHSIKYSNKRPDVVVFYASIISLGCNIGIPKMAKISSGVNQNTLSNVANWYFTLEKLHAANERILSIINQLSLPSVFSHVDGKCHSSSDGRKVGVGVDCLLATYSFKYFGQEKGVSVYTFIDDRQVLFHKNVMSASDREAAYVIDGINNQRTIKVDIHSTDTHGYSELIFATTHFLEVAFAPRIKSIGKQTIYAFSSKKTYEKLGYKVLPSRTISQKLIQYHWEDILRFMVTIKLNKVSASTLFKRLSSYAKDNPLYKAIKEFGRIIKSQFVLTYFDDVKLRQRIEKQLNSIESSNKFAKAIFYANSGEFTKSSPEAQEIAVACTMLIQNSVVLWNYLYLSEILSNCIDKKELTELLSMIREGSVLTWSHVNFYGEFDYRRKASNDKPFDMAKILSLKVS